MSRAVAPRAEQRLALDEPARLAPNDWSSAEVRLLECSERGFLAASDLCLRVGAPVGLEIPGVGPVTAYVTWCGVHQFAATFAQAIDLARVQLMSLNREVVLARLLSERAAAHKAGRNADERELRLRILEGLPLKTV